MMLHPVWAGLLLWATPFHTGELNGALVQCYTWNNQVMQLQWTAEAEAAFWAGEMPTLLVESEGTDYCSGGYLGWSRWRQG